MISSKVPYDCLFGRVDNTLQNYHRADVENLIGNGVNVQAKLKLSCGIYCVFRTKSRKIQLRYSSQFSNTLYIHPLKSRVEPMIMGMDKDGTWWLLNEIWAFPEEISHRLKEQRELMFSVQNDRNYVQFQLCFPTISTMNEIYIETDTSVEFIHPSKCEFVFIGSSVAQDNYCSNHMNICPYIYRTCGINCATLGVSEQHSLNLDSVVEIIQNSEARAILMDVHHLKEDVFVKRHAQLKTMLVCALYLNGCKFDDFKNFISNPKEGMLFISPSGDCMWDKIHLNDYGTVEYVKILIQFLEENGIILIGRGIASNDTGNPKED